MMLDKNSQQPLYAQLMRVIKDNIQNGQYKPGDQIPTETELSDTYGVSRITVRKTIEELCAQGFLVIRQGKGTFVEMPKIYRKIEQDNNISFSESCRANGRNPSSHVLSCCFADAEDWQRDFFRLKNSQTVYHIERILSADELPIIYEHIYFPVDRFPGFQAQKLENGSMFNLIKEEYHIQESEKGRSIIEVRLASQTIAEYLKMNVGEPVMILTSFINDHQENPLYISYEIIAGFRYSLSI